MILPVENIAKLMLIAAYAIVLTLLAIYITQEIPDSFRLYGVTQSLPLLLFQLSSLFVRCTIMVLLPIILLG